MSGKFCGSIMREGRWTASPYAYRYPGMNKVLQAAGRVIRTEEDLGVVLLLDDRFGTAEYTRMFPLEWSGVAGMPEPGCGRADRGLLEDTGKIKTPISMSENKTTYRCFAILS